MSEQPITFVPWVKQGLGALITSDSGNKPQSTIKVKVKAKGVNGGSVDDYEITKTINLVEPGDILGVSKTAIKKTEPGNWITNFESNYLPYVEFYDEDFPWRFTPVMPIIDAQNPKLENQLLPWLTLIVLKEVEFTRKGFNGVLETIEVSDPNHTDVSKVLPDLDDQWAWAHVQYNGTLTNGITELQAVVEADPSIAVSRILSSRRLEKDTGYYAFLVPSYERGRLTGLGQEATGSYTAQAWDNESTTPVELPFYHEWYFKTSQTGDFEDLARALRPRKLDPNAIGFREIDIQNPENSNLRKKSPTDTIELPGVITPDVDESKFSIDDEKWPIPWTKGHIKYLDAEAPYFDLSQLKTVVKDERGQQRDLKYGWCYYLDGTATESIANANSNLAKYRVTNDETLTHDGDNSLDQLSNGCTYSAWIKIDGAIAAPVVLFAGESNAASPIKSIRLNAGSTQLQLVDSASNIETINWTPDLNTWYFLAITFEFATGTTTLYAQKKDNAFQVIGSTQLQVSSNTFGSLIGFGNHGSADYFKGHVFDIRFYKSVLEQEDLESITQFNFVYKERLYMHYWGTETLGRLMMDGGANGLHLSIATSNEAQFHDGTENDFFSALDIFGYSTLPLADSQYFSSGAFTDNGGGKLIYQQGGLDTAWYLDSTTHGNSSIGSGEAKIDSSAANPAITADIADLGMTAGIRYKVSFYYEKGSAADKAYLELNDGSTTYASEDLGSDDEIKTHEFTLQDDGTGTGYLKIYSSTAGAADFVLDDLVIETLSIAPASSGTEKVNAFNGLSLTYSDRAAFNAYIVDNPCMHFEHTDYIAQSGGSPEAIGTNDFYFESMVYLTNGVSDVQFFNGVDANWRIRFECVGGNTLRLFLKDLQTSTEYLFNFSKYLLNDYADQWIVLGVLGVRSYHLYVTVNGELYDSVNISSQADAELPPISIFLRNQVSTYTLKAAYVKMAGFSNGRYGYGNVANLDWETYGSHVIPFLSLDVFNAIDGEALTLSGATTQSIGTQDVYNYKALKGWASYTGGSIGIAPLKLDGTVLISDTPNDTYTIHPGETDYLETGEFSLDLAVGLLPRSRTGLDSWSTSGTAPGSKDSVMVYNTNKVHNILIDSQSPSNENRFQQELLKLLNQNASYTETEPTEDPVITPPLYGRWHAKKHDLDTSSLSEPDWFHQVNLSPIYRTFAGMGAEVVRQNQEYFMDILWQQADEVLESNRQINKIETSYEANNSAKLRSIDAKSNEARVVITASIHNRVKDGNESVYQVINENSAIPGGLVSGVGRRMTRKNGALTKALSTSSTTFSLPTAIAGFNAHTCVAAPVYGGITGVQDFTALTSGEIAQGAVTALPANREVFFLTKPGTPFVSPVVVSGTDNSLAMDWRPTCDTFHIDFSAGVNYTVSALPASVNLGTLATEVDSGIDAEQNYLSFLNTTVETKDAAGQSQTFTSFSEVMHAPKIELPMYNYLYSMSPDAFLPNINNLPQNSVSIFKNRQDVIEAFFVGLNHEMGREMLWREYPTDQRGTVFNKFWGGFIPPEVTTPTSGDYDALRAIKNIHNWKDGSNLTALGENLPTSATAPNLILAIRGELLKKYPETLVYMHKAKWGQTDFGSGLVDDYTKSREMDENEDIQMPIFYARVADTMLFGYDIQETDAKGSEMEPPYTGPYTDPGYFFVFQEIATGMHFGMDYSPDNEAAITIPTVPPAINVTKWSNLSWKYFKGDPIPFINPNYKDDQIDATDSESESSDFNWGEDAGQMAAILYQNPILLSIHAKDLLR